MSAKINEVLKSLIAGDAAGYIFEGMKKGHIESHFREPNEFPDTTGALKGRMDRWRKPGLYSSISQFIIIIFQFQEKNYINIEAFKRFMSKLPDLPERNTSFFRNPGKAEEFFIGGGCGRDARPEFSSSRIIPMILPLAELKGNDESVLSSCISFLQLFTSEPSTIATTIMFHGIMRKMLKTREKKEKIGIFSIAALEESIELLKKHQSLLFNSGMNPDYIIREAEFTTKLLKKGLAEKNFENAEKTIVEEINTAQKTGITRATVDVPQLIFTCAVLLNHHFPGHEDIIFKSSRLGGASSALTSITAALSRTWFNVDISSRFLNKMINKKQIIQICDAIGSGKQGEAMLIAICETETSLTLKEIEEYRSRNKRNKNFKPEKKKRNIEDAISRHVVESWTKADKARWKKEKRKIQIDSEEEYDQ